MTDSPLLLRDNWYVGAWSSEVAAQPIARRILGDAVVFCRLGQEVVALEDSCCHRSYPLSKGRVLGGVLQCSYHGLCYDDSGKCVKVPGQDQVPPGARVRKYPTHEVDGAVWIWMGDPERANPADIPRYPLHNDPNWLWRREIVHYEANHMLLYDNLLDLSHVGYVHTKTIGGQEESHSQAVMEVERGERSLTVTRWLRNSVPPPTYLAMVPFKGLVDRWQRIGFTPGLITINAGAKDAGSDAPLEGSDRVYASHSFQAITPETEHTTHYFWTTGLDTRLYEPKVLDFKYDQVSQTFEEDRVVVNAQYQRRIEGPGRTLVDIRADGPSLLARRMFAKLLEEETSMASAA